MHSPRHTHGSHLLAAGMTPPAVSERLGYSPARVTADVYSHAIHGQDGEAARKWEEFQGHNRPDIRKGVQGVRHSGALRVLGGTEGGKRTGGSANGNRTRRLPVQPSPVGSKWLCFQFSWHSAMVRNTAMDCRRHSAVTAQSWAEGRADEAARAVVVSSLWGYRPAPGAALAQNRSVDPLL